MWHSQQHWQLIKGSCRNLLHQMPLCKWMSQIWMRTIYKDKFYYLELINIETLVFVTWQFNESSMAVLIGVPLLVKGHFCSITVMLFILNYFIHWPCCLCYEFYLVYIYMFWLLAHFIYSTVETSFVWAGRGA